ncbi:hypothetical protein H2201_007918 [Coniosporium apollinis]|uniref:Cyanovirin-N domain-containing protein n=1 Tax=Coniosporium apollinis TaxID=61459 RepID=A0ABQ9NL39_9PEZI|nr:hypothetical protein H2201_007918 [Coniosporium apollinis]
MFAFLFKLGPAGLLLPFLFVAAYLLALGHAAATPNMPADVFSPLPIPNADSTISKRDDLGVYLCNSANWTGVCSHRLLDTPDFTCHNLTAIESEGGVSSFGPDNGPDKGAKCLVYDDYGCDSEDDGDMWGFSYPGEGDLASRGWDDRILSYKCCRTTNPEGTLCGGF